MSFGAFPNDPGLGLGFLIAQSTAGAPTTGTWAPNSAIIDANGIVWVTTLGGSPGVWIQGSSGGGGVTSFNTRTGAVVPASGDYTVAQVTGAAPLASPALTGTPTAPTQAALTNNTDIATTAYADLAVGVETTRATTAEGLLAPKASPALTGVPTGPTAAPGTNTTQLATTAFVTAAGGGGVTTVFGRSGAVVATSGDYTVAQVTGAAPLASPALTGTPTAPTQAALTNNTDLATTAYTDAAVLVEKNRATTAEGLLAPLASPALTGIPTAPTPATADNSTKIATTAYVKAQSAAAALLASAQYAPAVAATYTPASATVAALDTANLTISFVAPASGNVLVKVQLFVTQSSAANPVYAGLLNHAGGALVGLVGLLTAENFAGTLGRLLTFTQKITGLTGGNTYQLDVGAGSAALSSITVQGGTTLSSTPTGAPAVMEVWAA